MFCCFRKNIKVQPIEVVDEPIDNVIVERLKKAEKVIFGRLFNYPILNLPNSIKTVVFQGNDYNHPLDSLPVGVNSLTLNANYNQPLDYLPSSLSILKFQETSIFSHRLDNLPQSLKILEIPLIYNHSIDSLPDNIEELRIGVKVLANDEFAYIPESFAISENEDTELFSAHIRKLPANLKKLYIYGNYPHLMELKRNYGDKIVPIIQLTYILK